MMRASSQKGNVFTVLLAAIGLAGMLGAAAYNLLSGPISTLSRVSTSGITDANLMAAARIAIMHATTQANGGDCDSDGYVEPVAWTAATNAPTNGGILPSATIGAPAGDAWGTPIGYCVWDLGTVSDNVACGGPGARRLDGTNDALTGETVSQSVAAFISAGPDRKFQTTCNAYVNGTTALVSSGTSDDIVQVYPYATAAQSTSSLWKLKAADPSVAELTTQDAKIGDDITLDASSGSGSFTAVAAEGQLNAQFGAILGDTATASSCSSSDDAGIIRYNASAGGASAPTSGLIHHWTMNENSGTQLMDAVGTAHADWESDDTPLSGSSVPGHVDTAINFDGTDDIAEILDPGTWNLDFSNGNSITISLWVKADSSMSGVQHYFFSKALALSAVNFQFDMMTTNSLRFLYRENSNTHQYSSTGAQFFANTWTHYAVTYTYGTPASAQLYVNGQPVAGSWTSGTGSAAPVVNDASVLIGAGMGVHPNNETNGDIDDIRVYNSALTAGDIESIYEAGADGTPSVEYCDGTDWVATTFTAGVSGGGRWTRTADDISYTGGTVSIGNDQLPPPTALVKSSGNMHIANIGDCGTNCGAKLNFYRAGGTSASPTTLTTGKLTGFSWRTYNGYLHEPKVQLNVLTTAAPGSNTIQSDYVFVTEGGVYSDALPIMKLKSNGYLGIGETNPDSSMHFLQDQIGVTYMPEILEYVEGRHAMYDGTNAVTFSLGGTPALDDTIIVLAGCNHGSSNCDIVLSDNQAGGTGTWSNVASSARLTRAYVFYKKMLTAGSGTFTISMTSTNANTEMSWGAYRVKNLNTLVRSGSAFVNAANPSVSTSGGATSGAGFDVAIDFVDQNANKSVRSMSGWHVQSKIESKISHRTTSIVHRIGNAANPLTHQWARAAGTGAAQVIANFSKIGSGGSAPNFPARVLIGTNATSNATSKILFEKSRPGNAALQDGDIVGMLQFTGYNNSTLQPAVQILGEVETGNGGGAISATNMPIDIVFKMVNSAGVMAEVARISSNHGIGVGRAAAPKMTFDIDGGFLLDNNHTVTTTSLGGISDQMIMMIPNCPGFIGGTSQGNWTNTNWNCSGGFFSWGYDTWPAGTSIGRTIPTGSTGHINIGDAITRGGGTNAQGVAIGKAVRARLHSVSIGDTAQTISPMSIALGTNVSVNPTVEGSFGYYIGNNVRMQDSGGTPSRHNFAIGLNASNLMTSTTWSSNKFMIMDGKWGIGTVTPNNAHRLDVVGAAENNLSTAWTNPSDLRLKTIDGNYTRGLNELRQLKPITFSYIKDNPMGYESDRENIGFGAQQVRPFFPEAVTEGRNGYLEFNMHSLNIAMINALKELDETNKSIRAATEDLRAENLAMKKTLAEARTRLQKLESSASFATRVRQAPWPGLLLPFFIIAAGGAAYAFTKRRRA